jgi:hypothetical protein
MGEAPKEGTYTMDTFMIRWVANMLGRYEGTIVDFGHLAW